jgi:hypothetical protein
MRLTPFIRYQRPIAVMLLYAFSLMICLPAASARTESSVKDDMTIKNIRWEVQGETVVITYDLYAPLSDKCDVVVVLRRESDKSFEYRPKSASGSVGKGIFAGKNLVIRWSYLKDIPAGLTGEDYYFEITATRVESAIAVQPEAKEEGGGSTWLWIVGGVVVTGGAAALLLLGGSNDSGGGGSGGGSTSELPAPPSRPAGN